MGAACQEPLGTCFLINALSDGVSTTQRLARGGKGKRKGYRLSKKCLNRRRSVSDDDGEYGLLC